MFGLKTTSDHETVVRYLVSRMTDDETPVLAQLAKARLASVSKEFDGLHAGEQSKSEIIRREARKRTLRDRILQGIWFAGRSRNRVVEQLKREAKAEQDMFVALKRGGSS